MTIKLIQALTNARGVSGFEEEVIQVIADYKGGYTMQVDHFKNAYWNLDKVDENKPTLMLDAHTDEVGMIVQGISDLGQIRFQTLGGWVPSQMVGHKFQIRNRQGEWISAICASKPIHFMSAAERQKNMAMEDLSLDIGANSKEEAYKTFGVDVGQPIVPATKLEYLTHNHSVIAKALDDRIGVASLIQIMTELKDEVDDLPFNLVATFTSQEEVGLRGAKLATKRVQPDLAFVLEGTPSDDFAVAKSNAQGQMGQGPQIRFRDASYIANQDLVNRFLKIAIQADIPHQSAVRDSGGTNAGTIHLSDFGVPVATISTPVRYPHTPYSISSITDFENTVKLVVDVIRDLTIEDFANFDLKSI